MSISSANRNQTINDYLARAESVTSFPSVMYIESTRGCPYSCIMCDVPETYGRKSQDILPELLGKVYPFIKYLEVLAIHGNGEPLLSTNIDWFVQAARKYDCALHMNTTGVYLKPELAEKLLTAKLNIRFSIHAGTNKTYRKIMGGSLERVKRRITYLTEQSARMGSTENDFWLSFIVMRENVNEIENFIDIAREVGISKVRFMALRANSRIVSGAERSGSGFYFRFRDQIDRETKQSFIRQLPRIQARAQELGVSIGPGSMAFAARHGSVIGETINAQLQNGRKLFPIRRRSGQCVAPWAGQVQIKQNGDVGLCCGTEYILGNLYEKPFPEIWNNSRMRHVRAEFRKGRIPRTCGYCRTIGADEYNTPLFEQLTGVVKSK